MHPMGEAYADLQQAVGEIPWGHNLVSGVSLKDLGRVSRAPQIAKAMKIPVTTLEHWIKQLRRRDAIEFRGSPKTGGYHRKHREAGSYHLA